MIAQNSGNNKSTPPRPSSLPETNNLTAPLPTSPNIPTGQDEADYESTIEENISQFYQLADILHAGGQYAYYWFLHSETNSKRTVWYQIQKPLSLPTYQNEHVYFGVHPTDRMGSRYQRAKITSDEGDPVVTAINCVFSEFDAKDFNSMAETLAWIKALPIQPSVIIQSGGGYHTYFLLDQTFMIDSEEALKRARELQTNFVKWSGGDKNASNLTVMLRVPGTYNRKQQYGPNFPLVRFIEFEPKRRYTLRELEKLSQQDHNMPRNTLPIGVHIEREEKIPQYITTHTPHTWLDSYIEYSQKHSPRAFSSLHEACGLWLLSAVVAGRAITHFGGRLRHTSLMIAIVARSSVWAKSHTIGIAEKVLEDAGMAWRGLPTKASPQAIIEEMADDRRVIELLNALQLAEEDDLINKLQHELSLIREAMGPKWASEGQRAWHISEFGSKIIAGMMRPGSVMADFSDFLRDINEKPGKVYIYKTRGHGEEKINNPYLAIIADTTPADLRKYAKPNAPLWSNGFFPRFAIYAPQKDEIPNRAQVAYELQYERSAPVTLTSPLVQLNKRLDKRINYNAPLPKVRIAYSREIHQKLYDYEEFIQTNRLETEDLDGTYARLFAEQCLAIAMLLALTNNSQEILVRHLQRAIECCERIRKSTDEFYASMTEADIDERSLQKARQEDKILEIIGRLYQKANVWPTLSQIKKATGNNRTRWSSEDVQKILLTLQGEGVIEQFIYEDKAKRGVRFRLTI